MTALLGNRLVLSAVGLVAALVACTGYLFAVVLDAPLTGRPATVTVELPRTGGLFEGSPVTYRGVRVGTVTDVRLDPDGRWRIRAGARVKVNLKMVAPTMRYHVALVDPLPAGLEALNPALKGQDLPASGGNVSSRGGRRWWYSPWWYEHENYRDERVEAFTQWLRYGVHEYSYYARATTPGQFVVPPTRAEEMYHPETFGRSASDRVVVE